MKDQRFCTKCGKILNIEIENEKCTGYCDCGFTKEIKMRLVFSEKAAKKEKIGKGISKDEKTKGFPHTCTKCGYNECDLYDLGAQYSDESNIYLYKCKKCGYTERQADGSGNSK